jgi:hypothetical protein
MWKQMLRPRLDFALTKNNQWVFLIFLGTMRFLWRLGKFGYMERKWSPTSLVPCTNVYAKRKLLTNGLRKMDCLQQSLNL